MIFFHNIYPLPRPPVHQLFYPNSLAMQLKGILNLCMQSILPANDRQETEKFQLISILRYDQVQWVSYTKSESHHFLNQSIFLFETH